MFVQFVQFVQYICTIAVMMRDAPLFLDPPNMSENTKGSFLRITALLDPASVLDWEIGTPKIRVCEELQRIFV